MIRRLVPLIVAAIVSCEAGTPTPAGELDRKKEPPPATVGVKALFRNDKGEILLVFDERRQAWEVPGTAHQGSDSARILLDTMARDLGIRYDTLRLGGLFTYHNPESGTTIVRPYYTAQFRGDIAERSKEPARVKWFGLGEAKKAIPYPASVLIIEQLLREPGQVWAAAFEEYGYTSPMTDRTVVKFRVLENFYRLN